jgi:hypothetical protein
MSVNAARRSRRASPAAETDPPPNVGPAAATDDDASSRSSRRRGEPSSRVVAFPEPTIQTSTYQPAPFAPSPLAPVPSAPPPPAEEPATLHPSDRRSFGYGAAPAPTSSRFAAVDQLAIGEIDQTLFDCPACGRPLALGARRCPGCGSFLVRSVLLRKAALFVATGVLIGGLVGAGGGYALGGALGGAAGVAPGTAPTSSAAPSTAPAASTGATAPTATPPGPSAAPATPAPSTGSTGGLPFAVRSAFTQLLGANAKFADAEADLRAALAAPTFDPNAVATTLRSVSAQTLFASQLAAQVAAWPGAGDLGPQLVDYYTNLHDAAATALDNSVRNAKAYQSAARSVAGLLADRGAIDKAIRSSAEAAGDLLPPSS